MAIVQQKVVALLEAGRSHTCQNRTDQINMFSIAFAPIRNEINNGETNIAERG